VRKAVLALISPLFFLGVQAFAQGQDFSKVEIKVQKVAGTVYMLQGAGGNIGARWARMGSSSWTMSFFPGRQDRSGAKGHHRQAGQVHPEHALARRPHRRQSSFWREGADHRPGKRSQTPGYRRPDPLW